MISRTTLTSLVDRYFELGGSAAEAREPKLGASALAVIAQQGDIPLVDGKPTARALRVVLERIAEVELGATLALKGRSRDAIMAGVDAAMRVGWRRALGTEPRYADNAAITKALGAGKLDTTQLREALRDAHLETLRSGKLEDANAMVRRTHPYYAPTTIEVAEAVREGLAKLPQNLEVLEHLLAHGVIGVDDFAQAAKVAYLQALSTAPSASDDPVRDYRTSMSQFDGYDLEVTGVERRAAADSVAARIDWTNSANRDHGIAGSVELLAVLRQSGASDASIVASLGRGAQILAYKGERRCLNELEDKVNALFTPSLGAETRSLGDSAREAIQQALAKDCEAVVHDVEKRPFSSIPERLVLHTERGNLTPERFTSLLDAWVSVQGVRDRAEAIARAQRAAQQVGVEWLPQPRRALLGDLDIAAGLRGADHDLATPAYDAIVEAFVDGFPGRFGEATDVARHLVGFLSHVDGVCRGDRVSSLSFVTDIPTAEINIYVRSLATALSAVLGRDVSLARVRAQYALEDSWEVRLDGEPVPLHRG